MYKKILKEATSTLTLLAVEPEETSRDRIDKNLKRFFKNITYLSSVEEALLLYKSEKFDLILVDIDTFEGDAYRFIDNVHRYDIFQAMAVCSSRIDDAELMFKLLNSQISCFIPKLSESKTLYQILSKVCGKIYDRAILMHYVETLEHQQEKALSVSCKSGCPMKAELKPVVPIVLPTVQPAEEEDDFMFFPEPTTTSSSASEDISTYQDYFTYSESDDFEALLEQLSDIEYFLHSVFTENGAEPQYIIRLGNSLIGYGNVLLHYQFFSDIGRVIVDFGKIIGDNSEMLAERFGVFHILISGFCAGLQTYTTEVWENTCENPQFFNDSIVHDAKIIMEMIVPPQTSNNDDDLVFF